MLSPSLHGCNIKCLYSRLGEYRTRGVLHFLHVVTCPPVDLVMWFSVSQVNIKLVACISLTPPVAVLHVINEIRDYDKIGGLKKELSRLCQQIFVVNGVWANQNKAMRAVLNLQSRGITQDRILYLNYKICYAIIFSKY
jgi:hypothetical protein